MEAVDRSVTALPSVAEAATNAIRYWEPRRLLYNAVLAAVVALYFTAGLPGSRSALSVDLLLQVFGLAVMANVMYCFAYVPDVFVQLSTLRVSWLHSRWALWLIGTAFAATITRFIAMGLFPGPSLV